VTGDAPALAGYRQHMAAHLAKFTKTALMNSCETVIREVTEGLASAASGTRRPG
jgi:hypothetical protein